MPHAADWFAVRVSVCLSACLSVPLPACLFLCLPVCPSVCLSVLCVLAKFIFHLMPLLPLLHLCNICRMKWSQEAACRRCKKRVQKVCQLSLNPKQVASSWVKLSAVKSATGSGNAGLGLRRECCSNVYGMCGERGGGQPRWYCLAAWQFYQFQAFLSLSLCFILLAVSHLGGRG